MTYGIRGQATIAGLEINLQRQARAKLKEELFQTAAMEQELSWVVTKFSSRDRWLLLDFEAEVKDGTLFISDRDTEALAMAYAAAGVDWHNLLLEYRPNGNDGSGGGWVEWTPQRAIKKHEAAQEQQ